jgi:hypothetical protein
VARLTRVEIRIHSSCIGAPKVKGSHLESLGVRTTFASHLCFDFIIREGLVKRMKTCMLDPVCVDQMSSALRLRMLVMEPHKT